MSGLVLWTRFHTEYGIWSGPGADLLEDLARTHEISFKVITGVSSCQVAGGGAVGGRAGKKLLMSAELRSFEVTTLGKEGRMSASRFLRSRLAAHSSLESAEAMNVFQCFFLAALIAEN